jgi:hypothetical protein
MQVTSPAACAQYGLVNNGLGSPRRAAHPPDPPTAGGDSKGWNLGPQPPTHDPSRVD